MTKEQDYIAHAKLVDGIWQPPHLLEEHLIEVGKLAAEFAHFIGADWAKLAGNWHDLGKFWLKFQTYIRDKSGFERENAHVENAQRVTHSTAGALYAIEKLGPVYGHILAYIIAGHHAGLPDWHGQKGSLSVRLANSQAEFEGAMAAKIHHEILQGSVPELPEVTRSVKSIALWIRMIFSCLVDADFLDTERYMNPEKFSARASSKPLSVLKESFDRKMAALRLEKKDAPLAKIRERIFSDCEQAAQLPPGLFSLTVPTGGGKTLSSLAFALNHAIKHQKKRIIYAIPYTSIIEQNAAVFRDFVGEDNVLEHHSNLDVAQGDETSRSRLASENWDAPLIVTTNVQLFESLHASRTSRCRKLHNLVDSVIILDEAQQLPRDFHEPITRAMTQMAQHFGVTWVFCTATQPVLTKDVDSFSTVVFEGLGKVHEIVDSPAQLAEQLKRVEVTLPSSPAEKLSWPSLSEQLNAEQSVLTIVNTRRHARELYELMGKCEDNIHLSGYMCAEHRTAVIKQIQLRLEERRNGSQRPLRVTSTQLIDTGVDVDFPVVFRAMSGLDSIAQSAGRCNRENKMKKMGRVIVFNPEQPSPPGFLKQAEETTLELLGAGKLHDPLSPASFAAYFKLLNRRDSRDKYRICELLTAQSSNDAPLAIQFRSAAKAFQMIDDNGVSIVVPYIPEGMDESPVDSWIAMLEADPSQKWIYRKLQRYTVTVPEKLAIAIQAKGEIEVRAGLFVSNAIYSNEFGLDTSDSLLGGEASVIG